MTFGAKPLQINAPQKQINKQNDLIKKQQREMAALKVLVCSQSPGGTVCQPQK
jgi:hypothetical protein